MNQSVYVGYVFLTFYSNEHSHLRLNAIVLGPALQEPAFVSKPSSADSFTSQKPYYNKQLFQR